MLAAFLTTLLAFAYANSNDSNVPPLLPREIDEFSTKMMQEDGFSSAAAPECKGQLGWIYHKGYCYMFTSYHETFLKARGPCPAYDWEQFVKTSQMQKLISLKNLHALIIFEN